MSSDRKAAIIVGILFLLGFAGAFSAIILKPILDDPNLLINLTKNKNLVMLGAFLELVMAFACANIAIWLYPILKKHNKFFALGAVGSRIIENVFMIVATLCLLLLLCILPIKTHSKVAVGLGHCCYHIAFDFSLPGDVSPD